MYLPFWFAALLIFIFMFFESCSEPPSAQFDYALYCEMVQIHKETNGKYGWPPYKGKCDEPSQ